MKNVSRNLFGNGILVTKPKTQSKLLLRLKLFLVFSFTRARQFVWAELVFAPLKPRSKFSKKPVFSCCKYQFFRSENTKSAVEKNHMREGQNTHVPPCARSKEPRKNNRKSKRGGWKSFENVSCEPSALGIHARKKLNFIDTLPHVLNCVLNITDR